MAQGDPTPTDVLIEGVLFWFFALLFFAGRLWSRVITTGSLKQMQADDYVMIATFCFYTALIVLLQFNIRWRSNLLPLDQLEAVLSNPQDVKDRIFGSKITLAVEQCMIHAQWGAKASLLILYHRMTSGLKENLLNKWISGYVFLGYVIIQVTFFGVWCRPFSEYWALPVSNPQCANYANYCITILVLNTSSDILMVLIPMPLIWKAKMKPKKKVLMYAVFSLGLFNIVCAVLNKAYNWILPGSLVYMIWYVREASTGLYVANASCCWPLFRKLVVDSKTGKGEWTNSHSRKESSTRYYKNELRKSALLAQQLKWRVSKTLAGLQPGGADRNSPTSGAPTPPWHRDSDSHFPPKSACGSEEAITGSSRYSQGTPLEIWRQVDYDIEAGKADLEAQDVAEAGLGQRLPGSRSSCIGFGEGAVSPIDGGGGGPGMGKEVGGRYYTASVSVSRAGHSSHGSTGSL